ncbi:bifunctional folylpolyglutamate synthase/dihydrofolate synthase [Kyrpidia spormannii]|uniref:bifunctional folylpolyglutamate synthase/dihydrofolate synthase n=1 Tax=Kyrpidia spormannii TaxID=2055160 RepID=UPI0014738152|nr:folylpolyglutamate synthase/dihydrofolate synthase family protein [Kyrpidia spormannii]
MGPRGNAEDVQDWLQGLTRFGIRPGLERMRWMLDRLGHPERGLRFLHVAGTNGKGSTCAFLESILDAAGYRVGMFISPPMAGERSRVSVGGQAIPEDVLIGYLRVLQPLARELEVREDLGALTHFEVWTLVALRYFEQTRPDVVVWETGLGGRLDSTNVVVPEAAVITQVGFDHMGVLGHTIKQIATEKAGIIKERVPVFTTANGVALRVIDEVAAGVNSAVWALDREWAVADRRVLRLGAGLPPEGQQFSWSGDGETISDLRIRLLGAHQCENAGVAVAVARYLDRSGVLSVPGWAIRRGLERAAWPGRLEVAGLSPLILLDGAHNPDGARRLAEALREIRPGTWGLVVGVLADKDVDGILSALKDVASWMIATAPDTPRAMDPDSLATRMRRIGAEVAAVCPNPLDALETAAAAVGSGGAVCVTGSLYMVMDVRAGGKLRVESQ